MTPKDAQIPHATHSEEVEIMGKKYMMYVLDDGRRIVSGEFIDEMIAALLGDENASTKAND